MKTIFEKIIDRQIPSTIVYEDDLCIAINDINPQAPVHILLIPKKKIERLAMAEQKDSQILSHLLLTAPKIAKQLKLEDGFRIVINNGKNAGETVPHMHIHIIGGKELDWTF